MKKLNELKANFNLLFGDFIKFALPVSLQQLASSSLMLVDTIMIGKLGESEMAAAGLVGQIYLIFCVLIFGINSGSCIFISQFYGKKDIGNIRKVFGISLLMSISAAVILFIFSTLLAHQILSIFSHDVTVVVLGEGFLKIIAMSYIPTAVTISYSISLRGVKKVWLVTLSNILAIVCNTMLNYLIIFGNFGFPILGFKGAAISTVISVNLNLIMIIGVVYSKKYILAAKLNELICFSRTLFKEVMSKIIPVSLYEMLWIGGVTMYSIIYARTSTNFLVSFSIASTIEKLPIILFLGIGSACTTTIGNLIGAECREQACKRARDWIKLNCFLGVFAGIMLYITSKPILQFFSLSQQVYSGVISILNLSCFIMIIRSFNIVTYVGIFRAGGDIKFTLISSAMASWLISIPLTYVGSFWFKLSLPWLYLITCTEDIFKAITGIYRFFSMKWATNVITVVEPSDVPTIQI